MPVLPDFQPENASYGRTAAFGQSMMERAQNMQLQRERADLQRKEFIAKLPLIAANTTLAQVNAKTAVDNAVTNTNLETKAAAESVNAVKEFNDANQYNAAYDIEASDGTPEGEAAQAEAAKYATQATYEARIQKLLALKAKYSYMSGLKNEGYKAFYDSIDKSLTQNNDNLHVTLKIEELQAAAQARADALKYGADSRYAGTVYGADARTTQTGMNNETSRANTQTNATARATARTDKNYEFERTIELRNQAIRDNDNEAAQLYQDRLNKMNMTANSTSDSVRPLPSSVPPKKTEADPSAPSSVSISIPGSEVPGADKGATEEPSVPAASAVAPTKVDAKATEVEIGGKKYPIFKDKNGKRAYKIDGHFVPIDTQ